MSQADVRAAMADARRRLQIAGVPDPVREASALFLAVAEAQVGSADTMPAEVAQAYRRAVDRRVRREPVSHITGRRAFWMHDFIVTPDVLDPRPETETLVSEGVALLRDHPAPRLLDLGTGSGCILLSLLHELPRATGLGTDISQAALDIAARNADLTGTAARAEFRRADWFDGLPGGYDLIVSNPPYIPLADMPTLAPEVRDHEPHLALTDGADGLSAYRLIAAGAGAHLARGGRLMVEVGLGQADAVWALFGQAGLENVATLPDLGGRERVVIGRSS